MADPENARNDHLELNLQFFDLLLGFGIFVGVVLLRHCQSVADMQQIRIFGDLKVRVMTSG